MRIPSIEEAEAFSGQRPSIDDYIHEMWEVLSFDHEDLFLGGARDTLLPHDPNEAHYVYVSEKENLAEVQDYYLQVRATVIDKIRNGEIEGYAEGDVLDIEIKQLPHDKPGILHIPKRGLSPGIDRYSKGTFYNWDSAFMIRGLVQDGMVDLAKDMVDNLLYEIEHYDGPLNANSTFCRSKDAQGNLRKPRAQLPLVASKVLNVVCNWSKLKSEGGESKLEWLKRATALCEKHHEHWMTGAHYDEATGLSKFDTNHDLPGVEVIYAEPGHYRHAYDTLYDMYERNKNNKTHIADRLYQERKDAYYVENFLAFDEQDNTPVAFSQNAETGEVRGLTPAFFRGDWAMRESGFDPSRRFGFMNVDIINHIPVCLNAFRKNMEDSLSELHKILAEEEPDNPQWKEGVSRWSVAAQKTKAAMQEHLWDDGSPQYNDDDPKNENDPMPPSFRDLNVNPLAEKYQIGKFRRYNFVSTSAAPLWTGIATDQQAAQIIENVLPLLERGYGVRTSTRHSGCQWDYEITFSPNEVMMAEGAEKSGYYHTSLRLRKKRVHAIKKEYERTGFIWEKMEVVEGTCNTGQYIGKGIGYASNDRGFGWTIAEYIDAQHAISRLEKKIAGEDPSEPNIVTSYLVKSEGTTMPAKDAHLAHLDKL